MKIISLINFAAFNPAGFDPPFVTRSSDYWSTSTYVYQPFTV